MDNGWLILFELVLVLGLALGFGIWQLRSVKRDERAAQQKAADNASEADGRAEAPGIGLPGDRSA